MDWTVFAFGVFAGAVLTVVVASVLLALGGAAADRMDGDGEAMDANPQASE